MKWEDVEKIIMDWFPSETSEPEPGVRLSKTRRLTSEIQAEWLFNLIKETSHNAWICEIGTLYGFLTTAMGFACLESKRRLAVIDHMIGSFCMNMRNRKKCIYLDFIDNMVLFGIWNKIIPFPMKSCSPLDLSIYENEIIPDDVRSKEYLQASDMLMLMEAEFELIYLDGDHSYDNVLLELQLYSNFLRPGGVICGDDYTARDVRKAVLEFFKKNDEFEPIEHPRNQFGFRKK